MGNIIKTADKKEITKIIKQYLEYNKKNKFTIIDKIKKIDLGDYYEDDPDDKSSILLILTSKKYKLEFSIDIDTNYLSMYYFKKEININETKINILCEIENNSLLYNYDIRKNNLHITKTNNLIQEKLIIINNNYYNINKTIDKFRKYISYNIYKKKLLKIYFYVFYFYNYNYKYYLLNKSNVKLKYDKIIIIITNNNYYKLINIFL